MSGGKLSTSDQRRLEEACERGVAAAARMKECLERKKKDGHDIRHAEQLCAALEQALRDGGVLLGDEDAPVTA